MKEGVVTKSTGSRYKVLTADKQVFECIIRGKFRIKGIKSTNPVAVGDYVFFDFDDKLKLGIIKKIKERKNYILRKSVNLSKQVHIIAANIDVAFLMITLKNPETSSEFIDRVLVAAESYKIPVVLLFNKVDTYNEYEKELLEYYQLIYKVAGYKSIAISATEGVGMHDVKNEMQNKTSVVIGHSGTGKSTMLNAIEPDLKVKVAGISEYHKTGKHTTTFAEMYELSFGGFYIDTPGIRGFGLYNYKKEELHYYFPEIFALSKNCKFHNCTHTHEPACAVKEALENDELSEERYRNYLNIYYDDDLEKYR